MITLLALLCGIVIGALIASFAPAAHKARRTMAEINQFIAALDRKAGASEFTQREIMRGENLKRTV